MKDARLEKRLKRLWKCAAPDTDCFFITSPENVVYLCGFSGTEGSLLLTRKDGFFLTDGRYTTQAKEQVKNFPSITFKEKWKEIGRLLKKLRVRTVGFESRNLSVSLLRELEREAYSAAFRPYGDELDMLRAVKDAREAALLKRAARIAAESLEEVFVTIRPGMREIEIAAELEYRMRAKGGSSVAFQTIVASGYRSALPHGPASTKKIKKGELITIDYGVVCEGYCSDETCTFVMGKPTKKQERIYEIVKGAHDAAMAQVAPGRALKDIDGAARSHIEQKGCARFFTHGTGHGVGLAVHEPPVVSSRSQGRAEKGMVFTIEPGVYLPRWGGVRIEDTVIVTNSGYDCVTRFNKELTVIEI